MNKILIKIGLLLLIIFIHLFLKRNYFLKFNNEYEYGYEHLEVDSTNNDENVTSNTQIEETEGEEPLPSVTPSSNITPVSSTVSTVVETPQEGRVRGVGDCEKCLDEIGDIKQNLAEMNKQIAFNKKWAQEVQKFSDKMASPEE